MTASAQGIDVSSFQPPLTATALKGLSFAFAKAADGPNLIDGNFAANWAEIRSAGIHRGAYHELWSEGAALLSVQATHFLAVVKAQGLKPGDMLAVVASDYRGVTDSEVREFCDTVRAAAPASPVLVYADLSVAATLTSCTGYDLWVAWPSGAAPASVAPWQTWRLWQWGETGTDRDAYNGTAADMDAWIAVYADAPVPQPIEWTEFDMTRLPVLKQGDADKAGSFFYVHRLQALLAEAGALNRLTAAAGLTGDGVFGPATDAAVRAVQGMYKISVDGTAGAQTWSVLLTGTPG